MTYLSKDIFTELYFNTHEPDLDLQIGDEVVKVHKILLSMHSSVLKSMLEYTQKDEIVKLDFQPKSFKALVDIISYKINQSTINSFKIDEMIELINLADYLNIEKIFYPLEKDLIKCLTIANIYHTYKAVKNKSVKKSLIHEIYNFFRFDSADLMKSITDGNDMLYFIEDCKKSGYYLYNEGDYYSLICLWRSQHIENANEYVNKMLALIDINKFDNRELIKYMKHLYNDFGQTFSNIISDKLNMDMYDVKKEIDDSAHITKINLHGQKERAKGKYYTADWYTELTDDCIIIKNSKKLIR